MGRVNKKLTRNRSEDLVGFFSSGLIGFRLIQVGFGFITGNEIWPDPTRSGRNLTGSFKIWPKSDRILQNLVEIWSDLSRSDRNLAESVEIWPIFRRVTAGSRRIWSENRNTSPVRINDRFGSGVTGLETKNR